MAVALERAEIQTRMRWTFTNAADLSSITDSLLKNKVTSFADGTGAGKAQIVVSDQRTISDGADETLDLKSLGAAFGSAAFAKLKALRIEVVTVTTGYTLKLKAGASNGLSAIFSDSSDELVLQAGGALTLEAPVDGYVVDATHKTVKVTNPSAGAVTYNLYLIGEGTVS